MLGHKTSLNKLKKTEIISSVFLDHKSMKEVINYNKKTGKKTINTQTLNSMLLNNQRVNEEMRENF